MKRCKARIEVVYADPKKRSPGESWAEQCHLNDDGHTLHAVEIRWLDPTEDE